MTFFGTDRRGPRKKIWVSERESVEVPGTHGPTRLSGTKVGGLALPDGYEIGIQRDLCPFCLDPMPGCGCLSPAPPLVGFDAWLPSAAAAIAQSTGGTPDTAILAFDSPLMAGVPVHAEGCGVRDGACTCAPTMGGPK